MTGKILPVINRLFSREQGRKVDAISLNNFKKTYKCPFAYRISGKNFGFSNEIKAVPLYAVFCIEADVL